MCIFNKRRTRKTDSNKIISDMACDNNGNDDNDDGDSIPDIRSCSNPECDRQFDVRTKKGDDFFCFSTEQKYVLSEMCVPTLL